MNRKMIERILCALGAIAVFALLYFVLSCASLKRTFYVGGGSGAGAAIGSLAGPAGTIGGAALGGGLTSAIVESDASADRVDRLENKLVNAPGRQTDPPRGPWSFLGIAWWWWTLGAYWLWLRRAHLLSLVTGREPRADAALRAVGLRTHRSKQ